MTFRPLSQPMSGSGPLARLPNPPPVAALGQVGSLVAPYIDLVVISPATTKHFRPLIQPRTTRGATLRLGKGILVAPFIAPVRPAALAKFKPKSAPMTRGGAILPGIPLLGRGLMVVGPVVAAAPVVSYEDQFIFGSDF